MGICELCGKEDHLRRVIIEGVEIETCRNCAKFGKPLSKPKKFIPRQKKHFKRAEGPDYMVVPDYSDIIKKKREKLGFTQEQFARMLAEKESLVQKMESGNFTPPISMARKIGKILKVNLVEEDKKKEVDIDGEKHVGGMTIGDIMKK